MDKYKYIDLVRFILFYILTFVGKFLEKVSFQFLDFL